MGWGVVVGWGGGVEGLPQFFNHASSTYSRFLRSSGCCRDVCRLCPSSPPVGVFWEEGRVDSRSVPSWLRLSLGYPG